MATILLLQLPYSTFAKNGTLSVTLTIGAPFMVVILAMILHILLPTTTSGNHLKFGLILYVVSVVNIANYIGMCCIVHMF